MSTIAVMNTKGGSSKSTVSFQVCAANFLHKGEDVTLVELDDENRDSEIFEKTSIKTSQKNVGKGDDITTTLREVLITEKHKNLILDVGGNKTTQIIADGLKKSRLFKKIDLWIIPVSGGSQDLVNLEKTYKIIKNIDKDANVMFALSRVRNLERIDFQYLKFFKSDVLSERDKENYFILGDSDAIDLSRMMQKSVYELSKDTETKELFETKFDQALEKGDEAKQCHWSTVLEVMDECSLFTDKYLLNAFNKINKAIQNKTTETKTTK